MSQQSSEVCSSPISDSPWFWGYVFACGGLIALILMGPKYEARQGQLDRNNQGRIRAAQDKAQDGIAEGSVAQSSERASVPSSPGISLRPLFVILWLVITVVFFRVFGKRMVSTQTPQETTP
ncbi:MAG: hypothetical protein VB878_00875 [Pirellulaceae bacterium]